MKKWVAIGLGILLLFTAGCTGSKKTVYSADSPEGVVQAYYSALKDSKPDVAYEYLKAPWSVSKEQFIQEKSDAGMSFQDFSVNPGKISGSTATVGVVLKTGNSSLPEVTRTVTLEKDTAWKISGFDNIGTGGHGATVPQTGS